MTSVRTPACGAGVAAICRVVVFGDSIADGLGARGRGFPVLVAERLGVELLNLSASACMVDTSVSVVGSCRSGDLVVVMHGITEAIPRVLPARLRWIPARWAGPARMDPRPYYSSRLGRRILERIDSAVRWRVKRLLMHGSTATLMTPDDYARNLDLLLTAAASKATMVIVISGCQVNDRFYPHAQTALRRYSTITRESAGRHGVACADVSQALDRWRDFLADDFHPSSRGHEKLASVVLSAVIGSQAAS
jgi:lysophospholipase L1-like esterase